MKNMLWNNWHIMRIVRLLFGIFLIFQGIETHQWFFFAFSAFFLFQAIFNQGCGVNNCTIPNSKSRKND